MFDRDAPEALYVGLVASLGALGRRGSARSPLLGNLAPLVLAAVAVVRPLNIAVQQSFVDVHYELVVPDRALVVAGARMWT